MIYGFDPNNPHLIMFLIGALMFPNAASQAITLLCRKNAAPMWTFHVSLTMNAAYACFICYGLKAEPQKSFMIAGIVLIIVAVLATIIPFDKCCCKKSFHGNHFVFRELLHAYDADGFRNLIMTNRGLGPVLKGHVTASHTETYTVTVRTRDESGPSSHEETRTRTVVTYRATREFEYASWEEQGNPIRLEDKDAVIHALFDVKYEFDGDTEAAWEAFQSDLYSEGRSHDVDVDVKTEMTTPGLVPIACGTLARNKQCILKFYGSVFGKIFWFFMWVIGYQSLFECIWSSQGKRMKMKLVKRVSRENNLRAEKGQQDVVGAEQSFRQGSVMPIFGPSASMDSPYAPPSQLTLVPPADGTVDKSPV